MLPLFDLGITLRQVQTICRRNANTRLCQVIAFRQIFVFTFRAREMKSFDRTKIRAKARRPR
jgi:hypothetical protein